MIPSAVPGPDEIPAVHQVARVLDERHTALHKRHGGLMEFAGGKIEPSDANEAMARREVREELGVTLD